MDGLNHALVRGVKWPAEQRRARMLDNQHRSIKSIRKHWRVAVNTYSTFWNSSAYASSQAPTSASVILSNSSVRARLDSLPLFW